MKDTKYVILKRPSHMDDLTWFLMLDVMRQMRNRFYGFSYNRGFTDRRFGQSKRIRCVFESPSDARLFVKLWTPEFGKICPVSVKRI